MSNLEPFLKTGVILANFNFSGKLPVAKESLTKNVRGSDIIIVPNNFQNGNRYTVRATRLASIHLTNKSPNFM